MLFRILLIKTIPLIAVRLCPISPRQAKMSPEQELANLEGVPSIPRQAARLWVNALMALLPTWGRIRRSQGGVGKGAVAKAKTVPQRLQKMRRTREYRKISRRPSAEIVKVF